MTIDCHAYLGHWPFRHLAHAEPNRFLAKCSQHGITQSWVSSFDALLHEDMSGVNERLAEMCRSHGKGVLRGIGSINPRLPDWEEDLRRCHESYRCPAIRLHPNYHGYALDDPLFAKVIDAIHERGLLVQLVIQMEDARTQHPLLRVADVDVSPLTAILPTRSKLRLQLLNAISTTRPDSLRKLALHGRITFDIGMVEGVGGVGKLIELVGANRVTFGSHFPLFHLESAILKLRESELAPAVREAITHRNLTELLSEKQP